MGDVSDLLILGGGPAGYTGAIRAAQLGMRVTLIEKAYLGGVCLNCGCIPTKAMFQSAEVAELVGRSGEFGIKSAFQGVDYRAVIARRDEIVGKLRAGVEYLMRKNRIDVVRGTAIFASPRRATVKESGQEFEGKRILICTGSENAAPPIPGIDGRNVLDSRAFLKLGTLPKSLVVIGGGVIGCELAGILTAFGAKVTIVEMLPTLMSGMDADCVREAVKHMASKGIEIHTSAKACSIEEDGKGQKLIHVEKGGRKLDVTAEYVLSAVGRKANTEGLGLDAAGIRSHRGFIPVNDGMQTSADGIYAAGDVTGKLMLAHVASAQSIAAVENMVGDNGRMRYDAVPKVVFLNPELGSVGLTEEETRARGQDVIQGYARLASNGKALAQGAGQGLVKVIAGAADHEILGLHMRGTCASELVTLGASMIHDELLLEDVAATIYPHPSIGESIREACLNALGRMA